MKNFYLIFIISLFYGWYGIVCECEDMTIDMLNKKGKEKMLYSEDIARIDVGDTITWLAKTERHNVQFVSVPDGVEKVKSKISAEFSYTFLKKKVLICMSAHHMQL